MKDECINCGAWKGLHHYETNQCPRNGQEAQLGKLQEWDNTVYQELSTNSGTNYVEALLAQVAEQAATIARLTAANESMQEDAVQNTYAFNLMLTANKAQADEIHAIKEAIEDIKYYYVGNPSAWEYYDDGVSEKIRAILKAAGMA